MSLRLRLTLLYASLMGGVLLLFGVLVYFMVSTMLVGQVDNSLETAYNEVIKGAQVNSRGSLDVLTLPRLDLSENVFVQVWGRNGKLSATNISQITLPLDPAGLKSPQTIFEDSYVNQAHVRVLSVPLQVNGRGIAVLQIGSSLALIDTTQQTMLIVLGVTTLVSMLLAGLGASITTGRALAPLETVTQVATHITRADDLSRRIPFSGQPTDEVGQLIVAFNATMARLETLFSTQRRFLADVSHELRTPLTVIKGNIGLLRRMGGSTDEESLSSIEQEVDRLTRLVGDLLLLAQAESGKMPLDMRTIDLDTVLLEVFQQMRILAGERLQVKLVDIDQVEVIGDRDRLKQVLLNLVGNAIKYTPAGGQVLLSLGKQNDQARLLVRDTGPGIPAQDLPHIFERFYRAEKSRTRSSGGGFGLGLSIAYWIVRNHGGRIEVDSKEGAGTTFCVWLPLAFEGTAR